MSVVLGAIAFGLVSATGEVVVSTSACALLGTAAGTVVAVFVAAGRLAGDVLGEVVVCLALPGLVLLTMAVRWSFSNC